MAKGSNFLSLAFMQVLRMGAAFFVRVLTARWLGPAGFGLLGYVQGVGQLANAVIGFGQSNWLTVHVARSPERFHGLLATSRRISGVLGVLVTAVVLVFTGLTDPRPELLWAMTAGLLAIVVRALWQLDESALLGVSRMADVVKPTLAGRLLYVPLVALFLWWGGGAAGVLLGGLLAEILTEGLLRRARKTASPEDARLSLAEARERLREAWPYATQILYGAIYLGSDVLLLGWMVGEEQVGLYNAAAVIILQVPMLAVVLNRSLLPRIASRVKDPEGVGEELRFAGRILSLASLPIAVGGLVLAEPMMVSLFSSAYVSSAVPFMVMLPLLPLRFVNNSYATALTAVGRQRVRTQWVRLAAVVNVVTNLYFIPKWGAVGAASTTVLTELVLSVGLGVGIRRWLRGVRIVSLPWSVWLPLLPMAVAAAWLQPLVGVWPAVGLAGGLYVGLTYLFRGWRVADLKRLRRV